MASIQGTSIDSNPTSTPALGSTKPARETDRLLPTKVHVSSFCLFTATDLTCMQVREPTRTSKIFCLWLGLVGIVLLLIVGVALVFVKYLYFIHACHPPFNGSNGSWTNGSNVSSLGNDPSFYVNGNKIETGSYMHIMLIIFLVSLSFLKIPEYFMLAWGTHKWLLHKPRDLPIPKPARSCGFVLSIVVVMVFLFGLGGTVIYLGVEMEKEEEAEEERNSECDKLFRHKFGVVYKVHCGMDLFSALLACFVRVWMIDHTYKVKNIWSVPEATNEQPAAKATDKKLALTNKTAQQLAEDAYLHEYEFEYVKKGEQAKEQMMPFVPWFLMPWLHFLVLTVINPHLLLTPWTHNGDGQRSKVIMISRVFYFLTVILYFVQILIQNGCAMRMNQYHKDYYRDMEERLVYKYGHYTKRPQTTDAPSGRTVPDDSVPADSVPADSVPDDSVPDDSVEVNSFKKSYILIASQMSMKFKDEYNFDPTFFSFFTNMNVANPFYLIIFIVGIAVSASDFLYK